ncbi:UDP-glucose/GDP-mannose dehydrogenase family protein [Mesorhizobium sp. M5C.F.Ca.IN.020.29.1.1]|uniref:UDP-glucose/GDP-mannose dehydrogenase family protein n=1 Tax=Mesorhizobium sp. M5C.F.Ca.IN.020.29.1.1 TaxID=2496770 RepID=UPI001FE23CA3|nr:UDP-glucose/GDP-mannose dehydrogenase family protein [Mesorhizobium sp. M5C.F.Ca.IN.020.29.1.1]
MRWRRVWSRRRRRGGVSTVAVLGVAFKPNTNDIREAPALDIIAVLQEAGLTVRAHDPAAMEAAAKVLSRVDWCHSAYDAVRGAGVTVLITEWNGYRALDLKKVSELMDGNMFIDLRNVFTASDVEGSGLVYQSVGRSPTRDMIRETRLRYAWEPPP